LEGDLEHYAKTTNLWVPVCCDPVMRYNNFV